MSKIDMTTEEIWNALYKELSPSIPFDKAKTVRQAREEINKGKPPEQCVTENHVRETLERLGWNKGKFKGAAYYWPPD